MVLCIIGDCGTKSGRDKVGFYSVPAITTNQGKEFEEFTRERRTLWISAIDVPTWKQKCFADWACLLSSLRLWQAAANWDRFNVDSVPTLHLTKKEYKKKDVKAAAERSERVKVWRKSAIERQEQEATKKRKILNQSRERIADLDFTASSSTLTSENNQSINQ